MTEKLFVDSEDKNVLCDNEEEPVKQTELVQTYKSCSSLAEISYL